jgi:hypothetical protein
MAFAVVREGACEGQRSGVAPAMSSGAQLLRMQVRSSEGGGMPLPANFAQAQMEIVESDVCMSYWF